MATTVETVRAPAGDDAAVEENRRAAIQASRERAQQRAREYRENGRDPVQDLESKLDLTPEEWREAYSERDRNGF